MKYIKLVSGILPFILLGCNFSLNPGKTDEPKNSTGDFYGIAVCVGPIDSISIILKED